MGQGILIHLLQVAMSMIQVNVISGLPHLCTQRLGIFHSFSFAFSAFFAVEPIWRLRILQTKRTHRKPRGEGQSLGSLDTFCAKAQKKALCEDSCHAPQGGCVRVFPSPGAEKYAIRNPMSQACW